jgi:hypothetical protein
VRLEAAVNRLESDVAIAEELMSGLQIENDQLRETIDALKSNIEDMQFFQRQQ